MATSASAASRGIFLPKNNIALQYSVSSIAYPSRFEREREAEKTKSRIETRRCKRPFHEINVQPDTCSSSSFLFFLFSFFHSFSPPFIPTRRLLFRFERISTMKSFRFSEIAEQTFDSLDFSKNFLSYRFAMRLIEEEEEEDCWSIAYTSSLPETKRCQKEIRGDVEICGGGTMCMI